MLFSRNLLLSNAVGISILASPSQNPTNSGLDSIMSAATGLLTADVVDVDAVDVVAVDVADVVVSSP